MKTWQEIPGETPDQDTEFMIGVIRTLPDDAIIVELGSLVGRVTAAIADTCRGTKRKVYTIDNFRQDHTERGGWITPSRDDLESNLAAARVKSRVTILEGESAEIGRNWEGPLIDFLFIDADHAYEAVKADLLAWLPNMKKYGIICLHDFNNPHVEVERAAREILGEPDQIHWLTGVYHV